MRSWFALWLLLLAQSGCMSGTASLVGSDAWSRMKPKIPDVSPDVLEMHYIFVERPLGDATLTETIWASADEHAIPLEQKTNLNANGIRVGKLGSNLSADVLELLEKSNPNGQGRRERTSSGNIAKVQHTEILPTWPIFVSVHGQPRGEELTFAQGYLYVRPVLAEGDEITLTVHPEIEFGPIVQKNVPTSDLSGWRIKSGRDSRAFPELAIDLRVSSGDYVVLSCTNDRKTSLGRQLFTDTANGKSVQKALLLRVVRPSRDELYTAGYQVDDFFLTPLRKTFSFRGSAAQETVLSSHRANQRLR